MQKSPTHFQLCAHGTVLTCSYFGERTTSTKSTHHLMQKRRGDRGHQIYPGTVVMSALVPTESQKIGVVSTHSSAE